MSARLLRVLLGALTMQVLLPLKTVASQPDSTQRLAYELAKLEAKQWMRAQASGMSVEGQFMDYDESSLTLRVDVFEDQTVPLQSVTELWVVRMNHANEGVMIGAASGFLLGIISMYAMSGVAGSQNGATADQVIVGASLGTIFGAGIGWAFGASQEIWSKIWP